MSDDDLRLLLHSPQLTLEPRPGLADQVRAGARRHRRRTRVTAVVATAGLAAVVGLAAPSLVRAVDGLRNRPNQSAGIHPDPRAPHATSDVVQLRLIAGARILTWFEGTTWCTVSTRHVAQSACQGPVNAEHQGFSWILPVRSPSLTVDQEYVVAGILPPGATRVEVHMTDGRSYDADVQEGSGFVRPVWSAHVDLAAGSPKYYTALDATGKEIARQNA